LRSGGRTCYGSAGCVRIARNARVPSFARTLWFDMLPKETSSIFGLWIYLSFFSSTGFGQLFTYEGPGSILLQNGNVLTGQIRCQGSRVVIGMDRNSSLTLDDKQIDAIGPDVLSLYEHQRKGVRVWGTGEHWHLAHWCIKQGLLEKAIVHYEAIEAQGASTPQFKQIEHMLREALLADEKVRKAIGIQPSQVDSQIKTDDHSQSTVVQASAEIPKLKEIPSQSKAPNGLHSGLLEHDDWARHEIPGYIRKVFQTSVVPILVARCGQSGCHGMLGKSEFHIYQPIGDQAASILAKDLDSVLRYIDRDHVHESPLLAYASQSHGIQKNPSLNPARADERELIERISRWVKTLTLSQKGDVQMSTQYPITSMPSLAEAGKGVSLAVANTNVSRNSGRPTRTELSTPTDERDRNAKLSKPTKSGSQSVSLSGNDLEDLESMIQRLEAKYPDSHLKPSDSKDPFDPDVFNRKFR
jgi:hypothetical protein